MYNIPINDNPFVVYVGIELSLESYLYIYVSIIWKEASG